MSRPWLDQPARWRGYWWLPSSSEQVAGELRYEPAGGLTLVVFGGLGTEEAHDATDHDTVFGSAENNHITLLTCTLSHARSFWMGAADSRGYQEYTVQTTLIGMHLPDPGDHVFIECHAGVAGLHAWTQHTAIEALIRPEDRAGVINLAGVNDRADSQTITHHGTQHTLAYEYGRPDHATDMTARTWSISESTTLKVTPPSPVALHEALDLASPVSALVALSTRTPGGDLWVKLRLPDTTVTVPEHFPTPEAGRDIRQEHWVDVYQHRSTVPDPGQRLPRDVARGWWFDLSDTSFQDFLPCWLDVHSRARAACNMVLGMRRAPGTYLETQVMTYVTAAESAHSALWPKHHMPKSDFKKVRSMLVEAVPPEHRAWVGRIVHNNLSLAERLTDIAAHLPDEIRDLLLPAPAVWARRCRDARNGIAHDGQLRLSFDLAVALVHVTEAVLVCTLLHQAGVPGARLRTVLTGSSHGRILINHAKTVSRSARCN